MTGRASSMSKVQQARRAPAEPQCAVRAEVDPKGLAAVAALAPGKRRVEFAFSAIVLLHESVIFDTLQTGIGTDESFCLEAMGICLSTSFLTSTHAFRATRASTPRFTCIPLERACCVR